MGSEWPKALYRDGGDAKVWGQPVETCIAASPEHEAALIAAGWRLHPIAQLKRRLPKEQ